MIEAVPALTGAVHDGGSSGSEGDFADDEELDDEERNGKRSISPGHARDTDCARKVLWLIWRQLGLHKVVEF